MDPSRRPQGAVPPCAVPMDGLLLPEGPVPATGTGRRSQWIQSFSTV